MKTAILALGLAGVFAGAVHAQAPLSGPGGLEAGRGGAALAIGQRGANTLGFKAVGETGPGLKALIEREIRYEPETGAFDSSMLPLLHDQGDMPLSISSAGNGGNAAAMLRLKRSDADALPWSLAATARPMAALTLVAGYADQERGRAAALNENTTAWVVGANYTLAAGTLLLGYGRRDPDGAAATRQLSIGYAYPLSKRTYLYADASGRKAAATVRQFDIGMRAAF